MDECCSDTPQYWCTRQRLGQGHGAFQDCHPLALLLTVGIPFFPEQGVHRAEPAADEL